MNWLYSWLLPQVHFSARGGRYEKLLTQCLAAGVPLSRVKPLPEGFTAWAPARCYKKLHLPARRCRTLLRVEKRRGLAFALKGLRGRWGLVLGPVLFCALLAAGQRFVWSIQYKGMDEAQARQLSALLYSMDICEGAVLNQQNLDDLPGRLFLASPQFGWLALNLEKGRLTVEADPALSVPAIEDDQPADLISAADGVILRMNVREGLAQKQPGQTVAQGELLVSAARPDRDGNLYYSHPLGSVTALVRRTYQCEQPIEYEAELLTGRVRRGYGLYLAGREWTIPAAGEPFEKELLREYRSPLSLFGFALPGLASHTLAAEKEEQTLRLTAQAAIQRAQYACRRALYEEFPDAVIRTQSERQEWNDTGVIIRWEVQFEADIARRQEQGE